MGDCFEWSHRLIPAKVPILITKIKSRIRLGIWWRRLLFIACLFTLFCTCSFPEKMQTISECDIDLFHAQTTLSPKANKEFAEAGFKKVIVVAEQYIEGRKEGEVDTVKLKLFIEKILPAKEEAIIVLDWEGPIMDVLEKGNLKQSQHYTKAANAYNLAYRIVKETRPSSIVGFYRFPIRNYHHRDEAWRSKNRSLEPLLGGFDALFPSVYDFYDTESKAESRDLDYVMDNVKEALQIGERLGKPVYPFVWHRYHPSNKRKSQMLIPIEEFENHVAAVALTELSGKRVEGIVWWGSDYVKFSRENQANYTKAERVKAWYKEGDEVLPLYYRALRRAVNRTCNK